MKITGNLYYQKLSFISEGEIKTFHYKQKLKEFMTTKPALQKTHKEILYTYSQENIRTNKTQ
jgi:hypothetical protein